MKIDQGKIFTIHQNLIMIQELERSANALKWLFRGSGFKLILVMKMVEIACMRCGKCKIE